MNLVFIRTANNKRNQSDFFVCFTLFRRRIFKVASDGKFKFIGIIILRNVR